MSEYLLGRKDAARRYGLSVRGLEELYKRQESFPIVRIGRRVMIIQAEADAWFERYRGGNVYERVVV